MAELLLGGESVCITGGPGTGKSCLARSVVHREDIRERFSGGVWWLDAAGLGLPAMCEAVGTALDTGEVARAKSDDHKLGVLRTAISKKAQKVLVVLDRCEDPEASRRFAEEGHRATLVTSRHRPTGPEAVELLPLNDDQCLDILRRMAGRELAGDEEPAALEIVSLLVGLPSAVALAGPHLQRVSAEELLQDLKRKPWLVLMERGRGRRTLKKLLDGDYRALAPDERRLFAALSTFGGPSFDLDAVQAVEPTADPLRIEALVRRSLVRREDGRYSVHPLVRRYGYDRLRQKRNVYRRMAEHYLKLVRALGREPLTFELLEPEVGNALAAMDWCVEAREWKTAARLALALNPYLRSRGLWRERTERLEQGRRAAELSRDRSLLSDCVRSLALAAQEQGDYERARPLYRKSLAIEEKVGDRPVIASTKRKLGEVAQELGDREEAGRLYRDSLAIAEDLDDRPIIASAKSQLGALAKEQGDHERARPLYEDSLAIAEELGDRPSIAGAKRQLGALAKEQGDRGRAERLIQESLDIAEQLGDLWTIASAKNQLGALAEEQGDASAARRLYREALDIFESFGGPDAEAARRDLERLVSQERGEAE